MSEYLETTLRQLMRPRPLVAAERCDGRATTLHQLDRSVKSNGKRFEWISVLPDSRCIYRTHRYTLMYPHDLQSVTWKPPMHLGSFLTHPTLTARASRVTFLVMAFGIGAIWSRPAVSVSADSVVRIVVEPTEVLLTGQGAIRGLLVHGQRADGRESDLTRTVRYTSSNPQVARVTPLGIVESVGDGQAEIRVEWESQAAAVRVQVGESAVRRPVHFENDIVPILSRFGCNTSACHGKAEGQNGFKLSVFGSDPVADYDALTKEARGRRLFLPSAERSLILQKGGGDFPHGGGVRLKKGSREYQTIQSWIATGIPLGDPQAARVVRIEINPQERTVDLGASQQLRVLAEYSDGRRMDVTELTRFQSNNDGLATVDDAGWIEFGKSPGQVAIMASFMGAVDVFQALLPREEILADYPTPSEANFIDHFVNRKLRKLNIVPAETTDDAEFLRRVFVDVIGTFPTAREVRDFLADTNPAKRRVVVEQLLNRPEYVDYWSQKWADLLRVDRRALGHKAAYEYFRWIRDSFAENKPIDRFAYELITAQGRLDQTPPARFYQVSGNPGDTASTLSQVFLGVRIACAQCHHHPFDRWAQDDYYGMAAFFQPLSRKGTTRGEVMFATGMAKATNPRSGKEILAHPLTIASPTTVVEGDARESLANWMTGPSNPWFARNVANRIWAHFSGRGLVEPVDDLRDTNPPSNPELLEALAKSLADQQFDLKKLIVTITMSQTYQRASHPNVTNELDEQNYSRALLKRIDAEVLLDAVCQVTGVGEKFEGVPHGYRAIQLWDSEVDHYFLKLFGRPARKTACDCERNSEPNVGQVLHVLNSPEIQSKLTHAAGQIARWNESNTDDSQLVDEIYLTCLGRFPSNEERHTASSYLHQPPPTDRRGAMEDLVWSLMNSLEFIFNH